MLMMIYIFARVVYNTFPTHSEFILYEHSGIGFVHGLKKESHKRIFSLLCISYLLLNNLRGKYCLILTTVFIFDLHDTFPSLAVLKNNCMEASVIWVCCNNFSRTETEGGN